MNTPQAFPQSASSSTSQFRRRLTNRRSFESEQQQARHVSPGAHRNASWATGKTHELEESTTGRRWIRWMHKRALKQWVVPGILAVSTLVKFAMALGDRKSVV